MENIDDLVASFLEVKLKVDDDFLKIKETLTRIGVSSKRENVLYQSCHILHKKTHYYIVHFKELFMLDGLESDISEQDIGRRNTITKLLEEWGLLTVVNREKMESILTPLSQIKILPFKEKSQWQLVPKYHIGKRH